MEETADDRSVDEIIARLREDLDSLEKSQRKDVDDETETPRDRQPKDLKGAASKAREELRKMRDQREP